MMKANHVLNAKIKSTVQIQPIYRMQHIANQCAELLLRIGRYLSNEKQNDPVSVKLIEQSLLLVGLATQLTSSSDEAQQLASCIKCQQICMESNAILGLCVRTGIIKQYDAQELKEKIGELMALIKTLESQIKFNKS